jgi:hypothetical protein
MSKLPEIIPEHIFQAVVLSRLVKIEAATSILLTTVNGPRNQHGELLGDSGDIQDFWKTLREQYEGDVWRQVSEEIKKALESPP